MSTSHNPASVNPTEFTLPASLPSGAGLGNDITVHGYTSSSTVNVAECGYCGGWGHSRPERCPRVASVEYHQNGTIKRVEFVRRVETS